MSPSAQPRSASAAATVRRTYGQRSRMMLARENSPVRLLPITTPVADRGRPSPSGNPASASACAATSSASQCVVSVERKVLPATLYLIRSNSQSRRTAAFWA